MKVGLLTFHYADNFGAVLQAYALQDFLKEQGHDVKVLDYRNGKVEAQYKPFFFKWKKGQSFSRNLVRFFRSFFVMPARRRRARAFWEFRRRYFIQAPFAPGSGFDGSAYGGSRGGSGSGNRLGDFDVIVVGSDQVWSPTATAGQPERVYFGDFPLPAGVRLVAYSASAGNVEALAGTGLGASSGEEGLGAYSAEETGTETLMRQLPQRFSAISVRESALSEYLRGLTGETFPVTLDPVLLAGRKCFEPLIQRGRELLEGSRKTAEREATEEHSGKSRPYLLLFQLYLEYPVRDAARKLADNLGLDLVCVASMTDTLSDKTIRTEETPETFLALLEGADYVVTTSYHGTAFSILFEKAFVTVVKKGKTDDRLATLLGQLGLEERMMELEALESGLPENTGEIDYAEATKKLEELRQTSAEYIKNNLKDE